MKSALQRIGAVSVAAFVLIGADAAAEPIAFDEALRRAMQFNHGLNASRLTAESAKDAAEQAGALPNPSVQGRFEDFGRVELEIGLSQTIELAGKRQARSDIARAAARSIGFAHDAAKIGLEAETMRRFTAMLAAERRLVLINASMGLAAKTIEQIETRVRAGATRESDRIQAEIAIEELRAERALLARDHEKALLALSALWGETAPESMTAAEIFSESFLTPNIDTGASDYSQEKRRLAGEDMAEFNRLRSGYQDGTIDI